MLSIVRVTPAFTVINCPATGAAGDQMEGEVKLPDAIQVTCAEQSVRNKNTMNVIIIISGLTECRIAESIR